MTIAGTGTGPFSVTDTTETLASLYAFVAAANPANATVNAGATQYTFDCAVNFGDNVTPTAFNIPTQKVRFNQKVNVFGLATLTVGSAVASGASIEATAGPTTGLELWSGGQLAAYNALLQGTGYRNRTGGAFTIRRCVVSETVFVAYSSAHELSLDLQDCVVVGAATGQSFQGAVTYLRNKIFGATQGLWVQALGTYTVEDVVLDNNVKDVRHRYSGMNLNIDGAYDANGVPKDTITLERYQADPDVVTNLRWKYEHTALVAGSPLIGAVIRLVDNGGATAYSGTTDSNGTIPVQRIVRRTFVGQDALGQAKYPYNVQVRAYGHSTVDVLWDCDDHLAQRSAHLALGGIVLTEAQAAALTGIAFVPSGATGGTVTLSEAHTVSDLWHHYRWWISQLANFDAADTWTRNADGSLDLGEWSVVIDGAALTGNLTTTGAVTFANSGQLVGVYTTGAGTSALLQLTDLPTDTNVTVLDGTGAQVFYGQATGTFSYPIDPGATGTWRWGAHLPGKQAQRGAFDPSVGGVTSVSVTMPTVRNPDGSPMYTDGLAVEAHVAVTFTPALAFIDIGDGPAELHAFYNATEIALSTAAGLVWVATGRQGILIQDTGGADYAFLTVGWRLRRASAPDANAAVEAYVLSQDGVPVDEANGPVRFLTGDTADAIAIALQARLVPALRDELIPHIYGATAQ